jgi:O-methyltransferase
MLIWLKNIFKKTLIGILLGKIKSSSIRFIFFKIRYAQDELITAHYPYFQKEKKFINALRSNYRFDEIKNRTIDHDWRISILCSLAYGLSKGQRGDFIECGVFKGDCAKSIINYCDLNKSRKNFFLLDSFDGFDISQLSTNEKKLRNDKQFKNSLSFVKKKFFEDKCVSIVQGFIPQSLKKLSSKTFCFAHIDMNASYPEKEAFKFIFKRLVKGGAIIFDDYGHAGHEEQKIAIDKIALKFNRVICCLPTGQGVLFK